MQEYDIRGDLWACILLERIKQTEAFMFKYEGTFKEGELAAAAACYAMSHVKYDKPYHDPEQMPSLWPWHANLWTPSKSAKQNLFIAGALILAELERLHRLEIQPEEKPNGKVKRRRRASHRTQRPRGKTQSGRGIVV